MESCLLVQILKLGNSKSSWICHFILQWHIRDNCGYGLAASNGFSDGKDLLQRIYRYWLRSARVNLYQSYYQLSSDTDVMVFNIIEKLPVKLSQKGWFCSNYETRLIHFSLTSPFYTPWKDHKNKGFLIFSEVQKVNICESTYLKSTIKRKEEHPWKFICYIYG